MPSYDRTMKAMLPSGHYTISHNRFGATEIDVPGRVVLPGDGTIVIFNTSGAIDQVFAAKTWRTITRSEKAPGEARK